jgi:hypothetical protein
MCGQYFGLDVEEKIFCKEKPLNGSDPEGSSHKEDPFLV